MNAHTHIIVGIFIIFVSAWALCSVLNLMFLIPAQEKITKVKSDIVVSICAVLAAPLFTAILSGSIALSVWGRISATIRQRGH